jgi:hypothetical protein
MLRGKRRGVGGWYSEALGVAERTQCCPDTLSIAGTGEEESPTGSSWRPQCDREGAI